MMKNLDTGLRPGMLSRAFLSSRMRSVVFDTFLSLSCLVAELGSMKKNTDYGEAA